MNWKLIILLSLFGLAMAIGTISLIPTKIEPALWLLIFVICARLIVRFAPGNYFKHGFVLSLVNCVWITTVHSIFYGDYIANHPEMLDMSAKIPFLAGHTREQMVAMAPVFGVLSGLIQGLFAFLASKIKRVPVRG